MLESALYGNGPHDHAEMSEGNGGSAIGVSGQGIHPKDTVLPVQLRRK